MATYSREYLAAQARQGWKGLTLSKAQERAARSAGYGKSLEAAYSSGRAQPAQHIMPYPQPAATEQAYNTSAAGGGLPIWLLIAGAVAVGLILMVVVR